ncbi:MAG: hypothetical protein QM809_07875 [Gordonia sp. (in: high G+C Gram-positive bacteria)]|uniref:hypothetical protein n=1 Tax=Gordonia sp. (in: high G+C Gram-positive bacteria) TaxID=84139 RepID=UPI0039E23D15
MIGEPHWIQWWRPPRDEATTIMWVRGGVYLFAAGMLVVFTAIGFGAGGVELAWIYLAAMGVLGISVFTLVAAPGDPMDWRATLVTTVGPPLALAMAVPGLALRPGMAYATLTGGMAIVQVFMGVRGRVWQAWSGYGLGVAVSLIADHVAGPLPAMVSAIPPNLALILMSTFLGAVLRPRARQIYALRAQTERETAERAAEEAAAVVRERQLAMLDERAGPLLRRIAAGEGGDEATVTECVLVEAALRDRIRAAGLVTDDVASAAWNARARGVRVLLLDDRTTGPSDAPWLAGIREAAGQALDSAEPGDHVTVRLLPAGREWSATVTVAGANGLRQRGFTSGGPPKR